MKNPPVKPRINPKEVKNLKISAIFFISFAAAEFIFMLPIIFMFVEEDDFGMIAALLGLFGGMSAIFVLLGVIALHQMKKKKAGQAQSLVQYEDALQKFHRENPYYKEENFYELCAKKHGVKGDSAADMARMKLAIKELGYDWEQNELYKRFEIGRNVSENHEQAVKAADIEKKLQEQRAHSEYVKSRLGMTGITKRVEYLEKSIASYMSLAGRSNQNAMSAATLGAEYKAAASKEDSNWAIAGGIAQGIAGPAAGIAVAAQQYAADERDRQARMKEADSFNNLMLRAAVASLGSSVDYKEKAKEKKAELDKVKISIWQDDLDEKKLMAALQPTITMQPLEVQGYQKFRVVYQQARGLIYSNVDAYVDGFVRVIVKEGAREILRLYAELPPEGTLSKRLIYTYYVKSSANLNIVIEPEHLWAIEIKE